MPIKVGAAVSYGNYLLKHDSSELTKTVVNDKINNSKALVELAVKAEDGKTNDLGTLAPEPIVCDQTITDTISKYWRYVVVLAPILLIIMITIDFIKALVSNNSDAIKKSSTDALRRAIAMVILLFLPTLLKIVFTWFGLQNSLCF